MTFVPPDHVDEPEVPRAAGRRRWLTPFLLGLMGAVTGLFIFTSLRSTPEPAPGPADIAAAVETAMASAADAPARSTEVFQVILPSLVYIRTDGNQVSADGRGVGSGVIVNEDGSILTAYHVVAGARRITVTFSDGTEARAEIVSAEPERDLAVLLANASPEIIVPAVLGGGAQIGDETFAVGNPLGLVASLSAGVISGIDRTVPLRAGGRVLNGLIQFDAAVNPGSSGGPLLNRDGQVIGIVTALANPSSEGSFSGIGFAVPIGAAGGGGDGPPR